MPHVVFVAPELEGQRSFLRGLERVGARVSGIGAVRADQLDAELRYLLDGYEVVADLADEERFAAGVRRILDRGPAVDRIACTVEAHLAMTARIAATYRLPGVPADTVALTRDKVRLKQFLRERDVPSAPSAEVTSSEQARAFADSVGYPVVLKPRDGSGLVNIARADDRAALDAVLTAMDVDARPGAFSLEKFNPGHEGFIDALVCDGEIVFEAATHFYPSVLEALRTRWISPHVVHTNRLTHDGYDALRALDRQVLGAVGLTSGGIATATHLEWFSGAEGLWFSELGLHPPANGLWDLYCEAGQFDLYTEWARAVCFGKVETRGVSLRAAGLINLRPNQDGTITHYTGVEVMQRRYGAHIFRMHLPPPGTPTVPIERGYLANAYVCVSHPDYDVLRAILADIGETVRVYAA